MHKNNYLAVVLTCLLCSASSTGLASPLSQQLQHLRVATLSIMTDFTLYARLGGDAKYERLLLTDSERFLHHLQAADRMPGGTGYLDTLGIEKAWFAFYEHIVHCQTRLSRKGTISHQDMVKARRLNEELSLSVDQAYQLAVALESSNIKIKEMRELALLVEKVTHDHAWQATLRELPLPSYRTPNPIGANQAHIEEFDQRFSRLIRRNDPTRQDLLRSINSEWQLLKRTVGPDAVLNLPMLTVSVTDRIQKRFIELEMR
jgi:hypothetical protein